MRKPILLCQIFVEVVVLVLSDFKFPAHVPARTADGSVRRNLRNPSLIEDILPACTQVWRLVPAALFLFASWQQASHRQRRNARRLAGYNSALALKRKSEKVWALNTCVPNHKHQRHWLKSTARVGAGRIRKAKPRKPQVSRVYDRSISRAMRETCYARNCGDNSIFAQAMRDQEGGSNGYCKNEKKENGNRIRAWRRRKNNSNVSETFASKKGDMQLS